jgi:hypothetical protein
MGSGPLQRKKGARNVEAGTSGFADGKPSAPDSSDRVATGLPLRVPSSQPSPASSAAAKAMAGKEEVFQDASSIFVVLGASVSYIGASEVWMSANASRLL